MNTCKSCANCYDGADGVLRCRPTGRPAEISCLRYVYEPGTDEQKSGYRQPACQPEWSEGDA